MNVLRQLAEVSPLIIMAAATVAFFFVIALRDYSTKIILAVWIALCLGMLILPGGQQTLRRISELGTMSDRASCFLRAGLQRSPLRAEVLSRIPECSLRGEKIGRPGASARQSINRASRNLRQQLGRVRSSKRAK